MIKTMARKSAIGLAAALALTVGAAATPVQAAVPTNSFEAGDIAGVSAVVPRSSNPAVAAWQDLQFGLFMHWGIYSGFAGTYNGVVQRTGYPEQIKAWMNIPDSDYLAMAAQMTAEKWDAGQICQAAKDAGMKYVKITTKHHDGFAMWDTATTDYNVVKKTPFGKDPIAQLATACNAIGIKLGLYFSTIDWTLLEPEPNANRNPIPESMMPLIKAQLTELLTNYGPISELWFDMGGPTADQSARMAQWVRELQPNTVINSRVFNDKGDFQVGGDNSVSSTLRTGPWESIVSIFPSCWGYCDTYKANRAADQVIPKSRTTVTQLITVISGGGQYAFNIGPKADGSFDPFDQQVLDNVGAWMQRHPQAITGAHATWFPIPNWGRITANGSNLYFNVANTNWTDGKTISLQGLANKVTSVTIDGTDTPLSYSRDGLDLNITLSGSAPDELYSVIKVALDGPPTMIPTQSVVLDEGSAVVTGSDLVGRLSPKGSNALGGGTTVGNTAVDGYIVNDTDDAVAYRIRTSATGAVASTDYRVTVGDQSVVVKGADLVAGPLPRNFVLAGHTAAQIRIELANPPYYADPLALTNLKFQVSASPDVEISVASRCAAGKNQLTITTLNTDGVPVTVSYESDFGTKAFTGVQPGKNAFHAFTTRMAQLPAGEVTVTTSAQVEGLTVTDTKVIEYAAASCG